MITLTIIGFGNISQHLVREFSNSKTVKLVQVFTRNENATFNPQNFNFVHQFSNLIKTDVTIIAVSDNAIAEVSDAIPFENTLVLHTSGGIALSGLNPKNRRGVLYPLQTFSKNKSISFNGIPICVEAENESDLAIIKKIANSISKKVFDIDTTQRKSLHVAAVFVCNFVNHLYKIGSDICNEHQVPFTILQPLITETANKTLQLSPHDAQTGPAKRKDFEVISSHLKFLKNSDNKHIYEMLTQSIIQNG
jgi:predicted short-subunit dehydrogenase-like oxidoreductase (DUF2520 family)